VLVVVVVLLLLLALVEKARQCSRDLKAKNPDEAVENADCQKRETKHTRNMSTGRLFILLIIDITSVIDLKKSVESKKEIIIFYSIQVMSPMISTLLAKLPAHGLSKWIISLSISIRSTTQKPATPDSYKSLALPDTS
jgi:hypothetical protein